MDRRCREILDILLREPRPIMARKLMEAFQVSDRTVRYDLRRLDGYLVQYGLPLLSRTSAGIKLQTVPEQNTRLLSLIADCGEGVCFFDQQRRARLMELDLLLARDFIRISDLCDKYAVSRSTVVSDLAALRGGRGNNVIRGYPHKGFKVEAPERDIRQRFIACLLTLVPQVEAVDYLWPGGGGKAQSRCLEEASGHSLFTPDDLKACAALTARLEQDLNAIWSDHSMLRICYALLVCLIRNRQGAALDGGLAQEIARTRDYAIIHEVLQNNAQELGYLPASEDIEFVALYALSAETHNISYFRKENHIWLELCAARVLKSLGRIPKLPPLDYSGELQDSLSEFLSHSFYRIKYNLPPEPLREKFPALRGITKILPGVLGEFAEFTGKPVPYAEMEALAALIYETCILEGDERSAPFTAVVVIGGKGPARAAYVTALRSNFPQINVTAMLVRHEVAYYQFTEGAPDMLISTAPLALGGVPEFVIQDMDSTRETAELRKYLAVNRPRRRGGTYDTRSLLRKVLNVAGAVCEREAYDRFTAALSERIGPMEYLYYRGDVSVMLKDMLHPENIRLDVAADGWETAVRLCGNVLVERGYVEPRFVDAMIKLVQENGPYIVIAPGLAFPHARPQDGAKVAGLSLIRLLEPVNFGNEDNDPVHLVIALSATDNSSHIDALAELFEVIANEENRAKLLQAKTPEEVIAIFTAARRQKSEKPAQN